MGLLCRVELCKMEKRTNYLGSNFDLILSRIERSDNFIHIILLL